jgi:quinohemoprotein ethanol dehydrogenase
MWNGGALATAGNLVFQGDGTGYFSAYNAATGTRLWRFNAGLGIIAAPMTYAIGGRQYVSILVGYGGSIAAFSDATTVGWKYGLQKRRLLTFSLDGRKALPPSPPRDMAVHAVDDPSIAIAPDDAAAGRTLFLRHCMICHGLNLQSPGGTGPDLRESAIALREDSFASVVHEGALQPRGMPRFDRLTSSELHQLYAYIRAGAREVQSGEKSGGTPN